ncbi:nucleoside triphosphate pyrophosphohydrolase [Streptomyces malaysiensis]|uniref:Phosphoribosyl-ATP pyrophosphohydrolase n=1 Tax=Streptomyces malaysiensis TaxID=92644 RepID=A0A2J7YZL1_STRMQ|nr:nucleoside triphosphate pyrophosphohydrolase [Streptomyces malaysiensis]PNG93473.1 hypothetical protein SMF913_28938 [Streptomyces malaysiensis]
MTDGKLVRDRIPEIIRDGGHQPVVYVAEPQEYRQRLRDKLREEVAEFLVASQADAAEELADVLEVVYALATNLGLAEGDLEALRARKAAERGGFTGRFVWMGNA